MQDDKFSHDALVQSVRFLMKHAEQLVDGSYVSYAHHNPKFWGKVLMLANIGFALFGKSIILRDTGLLTAKIEKKPFDMEFATEKVRKRESLSTAIYGERATDTILKNIGVRQSQKKSPSTSLSSMRNAPCTCGSGNKFKKCCMNRLQGAAAVANQYGESQYDRVKSAKLF